MEDFNPLRLHRAFTQPFALRRAETLTLELITLASFRLFLTTNHLEFPQFSYRARWDNHN